MKSVPSVLDTLLAVMPAEQRFVSQASGLLAFLSSDDASSQRLEGLDRQLRTTLLDDRTLDGLTKSSLTGVLEKFVEQRTSALQPGFAAPKSGQRPNARFDRFPRSVSADAGKHQRIVSKDQPTPPPARPARKSPGIIGSSSRSLDQSGGHGIPNILPLPAQQKKGLHSKHAIDAAMARKMMSRRAFRAGVADAWYSPVKPGSGPGPVPDRSRIEDGMASSGSDDTDARYAVNSRLQDVVDNTTDTPGKKPGYRSLSGYGAVEEGTATTLEQQLQGYMRVLTPETRKNYPGSSVMTQSAQLQPQPPGVVAEAASKLRPRKQAGGLATQDESSAAPSVSQAGLNHDTGRNGGLRGLASLANQDYEPEPPVATAATIPLHASGHNFTHSQMATGKPQTAAANTLADLARMLAEEARRAGIDLEQFRP